MIDSKAVRSPAGQKLIKDLMLGDDDELDVGGVLDDAGNADDLLPAGSKPRRSSGPLRPSVGSRRRGSVPVAGRTVNSAKAAPPDTDPGWPADRPATAPASSYMLLVPPQLPAARGQKETGQASLISPLLERHLVSRHTNAYLGVVTAVLHQVASPAATGAHRDTQRRPGTVPRDVYHHSAISPPRRHHHTGLGSTDLIAAGGPDAPYGGSGAGAGASAADSSSVLSPGSPTVGAYKVTLSRRTTADEPPVGYPSRAGVGGSFPSLDFSDGAHGGGGHLLGSFSHGGSVGGFGGGVLPSRGGSGEYYVPYLDRSYGSHAPMACAVDAVARRAEAHKALTRQRLLQKQLEQHMGAGGGAGSGLKDSAPVQQQGQQQRHPSPQLHQQPQQLQRPGSQPQPQLVLFQPSTREPYQLRMDGGVPPVALGLAWDTSPGVVAAAAATAATAAAAIAARAEGLAASASPILLRDGAPHSPSLRELTFSPSSRASAASRGSMATAGGGGGGGGGSGGASGSPAGGGLRRRLGGTPPEGSAGPHHQQQQQHPGAHGAASGRWSPVNAPGSALRVRLPRTPQTAAEAAAVAADAEAAARSHLPPAVRRGYSGQFAAQTVRDWETIAEPNRRMMQEIENATTLVRGSPSRASSLHQLAAAAGAGSVSGSGSWRNGRAASPSGSTVSGKRRGAGQDAAVGSAAGAAGGGDGGEAGGSGAGAPFGKHTSARSRRRYIRYSMDVFPELGLPPRSGTAASEGPFGAAAAAATSAAAAPGGGGWAGWPGAEMGPESEASVGQADEYNTADGYGADGGEYGNSQYGVTKGPRYMLAAAARVPVPVHLHPLPTPTAAIAAVVASGSAAGAAAALLPQWVDPLAAAVAGTTGPQAGDSDAGGSPLQQSASGGSAALPAVGSSSHSSLHGSRGPSRTTSVPLGGLSARGVGLQGHPSGPPPLSSSASLVAAMAGMQDEQSGGSGSWTAAEGSGGGSGPAPPSRTASLTRRHAQALANAQAHGPYHSSGQSLRAGGALAGYEQEAPHREHSVMSVSGVARDGAAAEAAYTLLRRSHSPSPPAGGRRGGGAISGGSGSPALAAQSSAAAAGGFGSPTVEVSLMPQGRISSTLLHEGSAATLGAAATAGASAASLDLGRSSRPQGPGGRLVPGLDLDLGHAASRGSSAGKIPRPGSSLADSRLSTPGSYLPAEYTERGEEDEVEAGEEATAYGDGWEGAQHAAAAVGAAGTVDQDREAVLAAVGGGGPSEEGWSFREAPASPTASAGGAVAAAGVAAAGGGTEGYGDGSWDAAHTPRLLSRLGPRVPAASPSAAERLQSPSGPRPSSATSEAASSSPSSSTARSDGAAAWPGAAAGASSPRPVDAVSAAAASVGAAGARFRSDSMGRGASPASDGEAPQEAGAERALSPGLTLEGERMSDAEEQPAIPRRAAATSAAAAAPQGPVLTHGTGYRVVTSVAAALVSEDPREVARLAVQRDLDAQLERSSEHSAKLKIASRASKALARAGPQHSLSSASLPPLPGSTPSATLGYSIVQPRNSRMGGQPAEEAPGAGSLSVLAAPVPAPAEMEAMAAAARALLAAPPAALASRAAPHLSATPSTPSSGLIVGTPSLRQRPPQQQQQGDRERNPATPLGPGSYQHVQTAIEPGRTVQMQDVWAT